MVYFTADLHLGHENIITHCGRPFENAAEMDKVLISNWNSRVTDRDDIYIVGDLIWKNPDRALDYLRRLHGRKYLIRGNHDHVWLRSQEVIDCFETIDDIVEIKLNGTHITLCHYPMMSWNKSRYGSYLIHGHIHNNTRDCFWPLIKQSPFMLNAGVDINWWCPATFDELIRNNNIFKTRN